MPTNPPQESKHFSEKANVFNITPTAHYHLSITDVLFTKFKQRVSTNPKQSTHITSLDLS
ncbi:MAG: hypothetical protein JKY13_03715, partial [Gammaproteobacteria bacterium]|nr:hypothetical protein [Gammaproteobacteria bacterium]